MDALLLYGFWMAVLGPFLASPFAWMVALMFEHDPHVRERFVLAGTTAMGFVIGFAAGVRVAEGGAGWFDSALFYTCVALVYLSGAAYWAFEVRNTCRAWKKG